MAVQKVASLHHGHGTVAKVASARTASIDDSQTGNEALHWAPTGRPCRSNGMATGQHRALALKSNALRGDGDRKRPASRRLAAPVRPEGAAARGRLRSVYRLRRRRSDSARTRLRMRIEPGV